MTTPFVQGMKHICAGCAGRFYDLARSPAICPLCQTIVAAPAAPRPRSKRRVAETRIDHESDAQATHAVVVVEPAFKLAKRR